MDRLTVVKNVFSIAGSIALFCCIFFIHNRNISIFLLWSFILLILSAFAIVSTLKNNAILNNVSILLGSIISALGSWMLFYLFAHLQRFSKAGSISVLLFAFAGYYILMGAIFGLFKKRIIIMSFDSIAMDNHNGNSAGLINFKKINWFSVSSGMPLLAGLFFVPDNHMDAYIISWVIIFILIPFLILTGIIGKKTFNIISISIGSILTLAGVIVVIVLCISYKSDEIVQGNIMLPALVSLSGICSVIGALIYFLQKNNVSLSGGMPCDARLKTK